MAKFSRETQNLIADFRGLPHITSTAILREEKTMGDILPGIFKRYFHATDTNLSEVILRHWSSIVGDVLSPLCKPYKISAKGTLMIKTQNGIVRQELCFRKNEILERIHLLCPQNHVNSIAFSL